MDAGNKQCGFAHCCHTAKDHEHTQFEKQVSKGMAWTGVGNESPSPTISKGIASHVKTSKNFPTKLFPRKTSLFPGKRILHVLVDTHSEYRDPEREIRRHNIRSG